MQRVNRCTGSIGAEIEGVQGCRGLKGAGVQGVKEYMGCRRSSSAEGQVV